MNNTLPTVAAKLTLKVGFGWPRTADVSFFLRTNRFLQHFTQALRNRHIFAGLEHPDSDDDRVRSARQASARWGPPGGWIQFNPRLAFPHLLHDFRTGDFDSALIISDKQMRNVIGYFRYEDLGLHRWNRAQLFCDAVRSLPALC